MENGDLLEPDKGVAWLPIGRTRNKSINPKLTELALKTSSLGDLPEPDKGVAWLPTGRTRNKSTNPELTELALKTSSLGDLLKPDKGGGPGFLMIVHGINQPILDLQSSH